MFRHNLQSERFIQQPIKTIKLSAAASCFVSLLPHKVTKHFFTSSRECWILLEHMSSKVSLRGCVVCTCVRPLFCTSSLADTAEPGVLPKDPGDVAVLTAEPGGSPSPATSWISWARMARSLARSWLSLPRAKDIIFERAKKVHHWTCK